MSQEVDKVIARAEELINGAADVKDASVAADLRARAQVELLGAILRELAALRSSSSFNALLGS
jgi:hypothetical protein